MKRYLYAILFFAPVLVLGQSTNQNYVKTTVYKKASTSGNVDLNNPAEASNQVTYFDGLGRSIQQIAHKQSETGKDIITHIEYDEYGRQLKEYLPYPSTSQSNMAFVSGADSEVISYYQGVYGDSYPFSEKQLEASPLGRVLKQGAPGAPWQLGGSSDKSIKFSYQSNASNEVKYFYATTSASPNSYGVYTISLANYSGGTYYSPNQLYKTIITDENGSQTVEYKDKEGRVVLKRAYNGAVAHDTYYVYDIYGNLTYVIPPKAVDLGTITNTVLNDLCYQYIYDSRNRLVEKKLPGKRWEFIVYDKLDRVVATGPALSPFSDVSSTGWLVTKYDVFGRVAYTGWNEVSGSFDSTTRNSLQNSVNGMTNLYVSKLNSSVDGVTIGYSNNSTLPAITKLLTVNYYDNYSYPGAPTSPLPTTIENQSVATNLKGLATGNWVRVLTTAGEKLNELSYTLYDVKGRAIRTYQKNHLGGYTQADTKLNFIGTAEYTITKHKRLNTDTEITVREDFIYSPQGRLREHNHKINSLTTETLSYNEYDELGQLKKKKVGKTSSTPLQEVDYQYNIRGWLTDINDVDILGNDLFAFKINYNQIVSPSGNPTKPHKDLYNGNISETYWKTSSDNVLRKYGYRYDGLNRLLNAYYSKPNNYEHHSIYLNNYNEGLSYDKNGNILSLYRTGDLESNTDVIVIDNLNYTYSTNSNRLNKVKDLSNHPEGFMDGVDVAQEYDYDDFGNMTQDLNKGINSITYNHLNLPKKITYSTSSQNISYLYNALGVKVQKKVYREGQTTPFNQPPYTITTDYLGGFHYEFHDNPNLIGNNGMVFFATSEGYVNVTTNRSVSYNYVYNYTDHLGNIRVSYTSGTGGAATILEENHYYPFGLKHKKYGSTVKDLVEVEDGEDYYVGIEIVPPGERKTYQYKYNGKEFQDELGLNMYAMDFRQYDPAIARWVVQDPIVHFEYSPYSAFDNNPVFWADPSGADAVDMSIMDLFESAGSGMTTWRNNGDGTFSQTGYISNSVFEEFNNLLGDKDIAGSLTYSLLAGNTHQITFNQVLYDKTRMNSYGILRDRITSSTSITIQLNNKKAIFNTTLVTTNSTWVERAIFGNKGCPECGTNIRETKFSGLSGNPYADAAAVFIGNQIQANPNYNLFNQPIDISGGLGFPLGLIERYVGFKGIGPGLMLEGWNVIGNIIKRENNYTGSRATFNVLKDGTLILNNSNIKYWGF